MSSSSPTDRVVVIGGGIGGLATAALLARRGHPVTLVEKNARLGGRTNRFEAKGFSFDMGPSWYLMPDVFEHFFKLMGEDISDHLSLRRLDPSYRVKFRGQELSVDMTSDLDRDAAVFDRLEPGAGQALRRYLEASKYQYEVAINHFMYKNYDSARDFLNRETMVEGRRLHVFEKMHRYVSRSFKSDAVQKLMEYQLVFLGSSPYDTPALYNIMSHIDWGMGVFYPEGGIYRIVEALEVVGRKHGVQYRTASPVEAINVAGGRTTGVTLAGGETLPADIVIGNADLHHIETELLPAGAQSFDDKYWRKRTLAPSAFIMYLGVKGEIPSLTHHNLAFGADWRRNFAQIFERPQLPDDPSYYVCAPSRTDDTVAPAGHENLFVLVPVAPRMDLSEEAIARYRDKVVALIARDFDVPDLSERIVYERIYSGQDFTRDYHAYGGSALGLAHTLRQTAIFRPSNVAAKVKGLYYVGAATNPGIGMPICLISAELAYKRIIGDSSSGPLPTPDAIPAETAA